MKIKTLRIICQSLFTAFSNGYIKGFLTGKIYTGNLKYLCSPGLNCYSCPGSLFSCPIGSLQAVLNSREYKFSLYVIGLLFMSGTVFGRLICSFLCPFGLVQDLLYKIPFFKKIKTLPKEKYLRKIKYFILLIFVILIPAFVFDETGTGFPSFCKYLCPQGMLEGGLILTTLNTGLKNAIGFLFYHKLAILIFVAIFSVIVYRPFCRYFCPLGAIYGFFNRFSVYHYEIDTNSCINCGLCQKTCKFDINIAKNPFSSDCIKCGDCVQECPKQCIKPVWRFTNKKEQK